MPIPVTLLYGGLTALFVTILGANVSRLRGASGAFVGDPVPPELVRPIRAHGNAAEWAPLGILLLLLLELSGAGNRFALHLLGGSFFLGRVLHAYGVTAKSPAALAGAGINYLVLVVMSGWAIWLRLARYGL
jgi:uncharacterized protein